MSNIHLFSLFTLALINSFPSVQPAPCHEADSSALLQFKQSFVISKFASVSPLSYPKTNSWIPSSNCCLWLGVKCDEQTGHVIGLDISSSQIYGFIGSNNTLFHLSQLQRLNISDNHFNSSRIPSSIANLSRLTHLDLYRSKFSGEIPMQIGNLNALLVLDMRLCQFSGSIPSSLSNLTKLMYLDLGHNNDITSSDISWIGNLNRLSYLDLTSVNISSEIPNSFVNITQLSYLVIQNSNLVGQIPAWIMIMTNLRGLVLSDNNLNGMIPHSIFSLEFLNYLYLGENYLVGQLELNKFFSNFKNLTGLYLSYNNLSLVTKPSPINVSLAKNVRYLLLASCNMNKFPKLLKDQDQLEELDL